MLIEAALAMEIQRTNPKLDDKVSQKYARLVVEEATARDLDPWVFHGIIHTETRWKAGIIVHEHDGTCSIGLGGINVKKCDSPRARELRDPQRNIQAMGSFLSTIRARCAHHCDGLGWLRAYNGGDREYVPKKVGPIVERCHVTYELPLREVQAEVQPPGLWGCEDN